MRRINLPYLIVGAGLMMVLASVIFILRFFRPSLPLTAADFPRARGPMDAHVQIIEYSDFECPACQAAQTPISELLTRHSGKVRLVFEHFPLESHRWSPLAHHAAECAARQNQFWKYHDRLYLEQSTWSRAVQSPLESLVRYANELGLDLDLFTRCLSDTRIDREIQQEKSAGLGLGVRSTPSFFVNGKLVANAKSLREEIEKLIS